MSTDNRSDQSKPLPSSPTSDGVLHGWAVTVSPESKTWAKTYGLWTDHDACVEWVRANGWHPSDCAIVPVNVAVRQAASSPTSEGREEVKLGQAFVSRVTSEDGSVDSPSVIGRVERDDELATLRASLEEAQARATEAEAQIERTSTALLNISDTLRARGFGGRDQLDERVIAMAQEMDKRGQLLAEAQAENAGLLTERSAASNAFAAKERAWLESIRKTQDKLATAQAEIERLKVERDEARDIVRELDAKHNNGCDVYAVAVMHEDGSVSFRDPDPIPEWRKRKSDGAQ